MIDTLLAKIVGTQNERELKRLRPIVAQVGALEPATQALSDEQLRGKTAEFKTRIANGETLDDLLPEAFAVVREAGRRVLNMRHFDVQLIGGAVLHKGKIAEMKTGEGKTLVATLPAYLNALEGKGVHVVTVNDYLARRDSEWMGRIYRFLGMSVGVIQHELTDAQRTLCIEQHPALLPRAGSYDVVFDTSSGSAAGRFTFRFWIGDTKPPTLRPLARVLPRGARLRIAATDPGGSGVDPASIEAKVDGRSRRVTIRGSVISVDTRGLAPGGHRLILRASDYQETRNNENVARILPNTRTLTFAFRVTA